jgi:meiotically up-regulated gene 157 (Mug157) protein
MWLRDSTWQVNGYVRYAPRETHLFEMLRGLLQRQWYSVQLDGYANAFNPTNNGQGHQNDLRVPPMTPGLYEGKFEVDSLCCVLHLTNYLYEHTGDTSLFTADWKNAIRVIYDIFRYQQAATVDMGLQDPLYYSFARKTTVPTDTLQHQVGSPAVRTGLIKSPFRPSDDATTLPFFIPANAFAVVELRKTATILAAVLNDTTTSQQFSSLADEIDAAIKQYGIITDPSNSSQQIYAFEVDGCGSAYLIDDANIPSLLALPFFGYVAPTDPIYLNTRRRLLSRLNPYWSDGVAASGIGSPHTGLNMIWPMGIIMQAMTSTDPAEITQCLKDLVVSAAGTGFMHESFYKDNPLIFTRSWFAMANSLFGALILHLIDTNPTLLNTPLPW